jgi:hypothetical protein
MIYGIDEVIGRLEQVGVRTAYAMGVRMEVFGTEVADYMKQHRPWHDRTGNARASIHSEFSKGEGTYRIAFGIGVFYGKYLELSNGGRYRIVRPTQDGLRRQFMESFRGTLTG